MQDAEGRLRLAAESLNREALELDVDAFTQQLLDRLGIALPHEGCAGDSSIRVDQQPEAGPDRGGRRRNSNHPDHDEFFNSELEELMKDTTLHAQPRALRRIAELLEFFGRGAEARQWWIRASIGGDELAMLTAAEWRGGEVLPRGQAHG